MLRPKEFPFIVVEPGMNLFLLSVVCDLKVAAETLRALYKIFQEHRAEVLRGYQQRLPEGFESILFIDVSETPNLEQFTEAIKGLRGPFSVEWVGPKKNVLVDLLHFPLTSRGGVRMIIFSARILSEVFTELYKTFGSGATFIIYKMGLKYGESLASHFKRMLTFNGIELPPREISDIFFRYVMSAGWYILKKLEISEKRGIRIRLRVKELWEAQARKGLKIEGLACDLFRGMLVAFFTTLYGIKFKAIEVSCEAKESPYCEFALTEE
jgi:predicted hydrocarbon binding protein